MKIKPNPYIVIELMAVTFKRRHKEILYQPTPVSSILLRFPFLRGYEEVLLVKNINSKNYNFSV